VTVPATRTDIPGNLSIADFRSTLPMEEAADHRLFIIDRELALEHLQSTINNLDATRR
jgi:hypothetical protein